MMDNSINDNNPHPLVVLSGRGCGDLTKRICDYLSIPMGESSNTPFPNGETIIKTSEVRGRDVFVVLSLCRQYSANKFGHTGVNDCWSELLVFGDTLRRASAQRITAVIPHFGYARQDRKATGRTPITARLVADSIVMAGFNRALTMDLHAPQIQGFFPREVPLDHLNAGQLFADYFASLSLKNAVVLSPDVGNLKKAERYRRGFPVEVGLAYVDKVRDSDGNVVSQRIAGDPVEGKTCFLLDDIISTAGTARGAIDLALEQGAKDFYVAATHGEFVSPAVERLSHPSIKRVITTDTIPVLDHMSKLNLEILSSAELFGEAILRIHQFESISELLGIYG